MTSGCPCRCGTRSRLTSASVRRSGTVPASTGWCDVKDRVSEFLALHEHNCTAPPITGFCWRCWLGPIPHTRPSTGRWRGSSAWSRAMTRCAGSTCRISAGCCGECRHGRRTHGRRLWPTGCSSSSATRLRPPRDGPSGGTASRATAPTRSRSEASSISYARCTSMPRRSSPGRAGAVHRWCRARPLDSGRRRRMAMDDRCA